MRRKISPPTGFVATWYFPFTNFECVMLIGIAQNYEWKLGMF